MSLSSKPEFDKLILWLGSLNKWQDFGAFLPEIEGCDIEKIEINHPGDIEGQKRALYNKWLQVYPNASWQDVITALEKAKQNAIVDEIKQNLGVQQTQNSPQEAASEASAIGVQPKVVTGQVNVNPDKLRTTLRDVLTTQFADLSDALEDAEVLNGVAGQLFAKGVIAKAVKNNPTYNSVINEFEAGLKFQKNPSEIEEYCKLLLESLSSQRGAAKYAAKGLKDKWKDTIEKEFGITLFD